MEELEHLRSMWQQKIKRSTKLIIPKVVFEKNTGSLTNTHWAYNIPYAFREALDLKCEQRKKNKIRYKTWTQGPRINFKQGDTITKQTGDICIQVQFASTMGWDPVKNKMDEGFVTYNMYSIINNKYELLDEIITCTQMQFLELIINGTYKN